MKKHLALLLLFWGMILTGFSQTQPKAETIRTSQETIMVNELASFHMQYLMDEFMQGTIYFTEEGPADGKINYNILLEAIQYYDDNDKLLTVPAEQAIDSVELAGHILVPFNKGFAEVFHTENGSVVLHRSIRYKVQKIVRGAYGSIERTSAVDQVSSLAGDGAMGSDLRHNLRLANYNNEEMELRLHYQQQFYFPAAEGQFIELSSRKNVERAFPEHRRKIKSFFRKNKIDFDSAESLKQLASFMHSLQDSL